MWVNKSLRVNGLSVPLSPNSYVETITRAPQKVTELGDKVFKKVIQFFTIRHDWCPYNKGKFGLRYTHTHTMHTHLAHGGNAFALCKPRGLGTFDTHTLLHTHGLLHAHTCPHTEHPRMCVCTLTHTHTHVLQGTVSLSLRPQHLVI